MSLQPEPHRSGQHESGQQGAAAQEPPPELDEEAVRSALRRSRCPAETVETAVEFIIHDLYPLVVVARLSGLPSDWEALTPAFVEYMAPEGFRAIAATPSGREMSGKYYRVAQSALHLENSELAILKGLNKKVAGRILAAEGGRKRFSKEECRSFCEQEIVPLIARMRETEAREDYAALAFIYFENDPRFSATLGHFASSSGWYDGLLGGYLGLSQEEISLIRRHAIDLGAEKRAEGSRRFSISELQNWADTEVLPLLLQALETGDYSPLAAQRFEEEPRMERFCHFVSGEKSAWLRSLGKYFRLEEETVEAIEEAQRRLRGERISQAKRGKSIQGASEENTRSSIPSLEQRGGQQASGSLRRPENPEASKVEAGDFTVVVRTGTVLGDGISPTYSPPSSRPLDTLPPAQQLRLLFPHMRSAQDWDSIAALYSENLKSLSSFIGLRAGVAYLAQLVKAGEAPSPEKALSVCSGTGDLFSAFQQLELPPGYLSGLSPDITEVDFSAEMLKRSPNRRERKLQADVRTIGELSLPHQQYNLIECSCMQRFPVEAVAGFIVFANKTLTPGGVLMLKMDGRGFPPSFEDALISAGFETIGPYNSEIEMFPLSFFPEAQIAPINIRRALSSTRFVFAKKVAEFSVLDSDACLLRNDSPIHLDISPSSIEAIQSILRERATRLGVMYQNLESLGTAIGILREDPFFFRHRTAANTAIQLIARCKLLDPKAFGARTLSTIIGALDEQINMLLKFVPEEYLVPKSFQITPPTRDVRYRAKEEQFQKGYKLLLWNFKSQGMDTESELSRVVSSTLGLSSLGVELEEYFRTAHFADFELLEKPLVEYFRKIFRLIDHLEQQIIDNRRTGRTERNVIVSLALMRDAFPEYRFNAESH